MSSGLIYPLYTGVVFIGTVVWAEKARRKNFWVFWTQKRSCLLEVANT
jgi:hypothetical protein